MENDNTASIPPFPPPLPILLDTLPEPRVAGGDGRAPTTPHRPGDAALAAARMLGGGGEGSTFTRIRRRDVLDGLLAALSGIPDADLPAVAGKLGVPGNPKCKSCFGKGRITRLPRSGELDGIIKDDAGTVPDSVKANIKVEDDCRCVVAERTAILRRETERRARGGAALPQARGEVTPPQVDDVVPSQP